MAQPDDHAPPDEARLTLQVRCRRCGAWLSSPRSIARAVGPQCRRADAEVTP